MLKSYLFYHRGRMMDIPYKTLVISVALFRGTILNQDEFDFFVLFNDTWSQKGHSASYTTVILASSYLLRLL